MAINRTRLVQLLRGSAVPAYQYYVPLMPQHDPALDQHPVYAFDQQKAAALVKAGGYRGSLIGASRRHGSELAVQYRAGNPIGSGGDRHQPHPARHRPQRGVYNRREADRP